METIIFEFDKMSYREIINGQSPNWNRPFERIEFYITDKSGPNEGCDYDKIASFKAPSRFVLDFKSKRGYSSGNIAEWDHQPDRSEIMAVVKSIISGMQHMMEPVKTIY